MVYKPAEVVTHICVWRSVTMSYPWYPPHPHFCDICVAMVYFLSFPLLYTDNVLFQCVLFNFCFVLFATSLCFVILLNSCMFYSVMLCCMTSQICVCVAIMYIFICDATAKQTVTHKVSVRMRMKKLPQNFLRTAPKKKKRTPDKNNPTMSLSGSFAFKAVTCALYGDAGSLDEWCRSCQPSR